jgi:hypothetical protein
MIERQPSDQKLLELATARSPAPPGPLAEGQRELRACWLDMGQALDAENEDFSEDEFLDRLLFQESRQVALSQRARVASDARVWPALLASALALSLLMVIMHSSWLSEGAGIAGLAPGTNGPAEELPADGLAWTDSLDEELDAAAERVGTFVAPGTGVDDSLANLADHLESMSDELYTSAL